MTVPLASSLYQNHSLVTSSGRESQRHLKRVIYEPLKCGQRSDHNYPHGEAIPKTRESNIAVDASDGLPSSFARFPVRVELRHHDIRGMRNDGTCNTGDIASQERNSRLLEPVVGGFGLAKVLVDLVDGGLKGCEFAHRVRDLAAPEGIETFVEAGKCE